MPADKPIGAFSATLNAAAYPAATRLAWAQQYAGTVGASHTGVLDLNPSGASLGIAYSGTYAAEASPHLRSIDLNGASDTPSVDFGCFELGFIVDGTTWGYQELMGQYGTGRWVLEYTGTAFSVFDSGGFTGDTGPYAYTPVADDFIHIFVNWTASSFRLTIYVNEARVFDSSHGSGTYAAVQTGRVRSASGERRGVFFNHYSDQLTLAEMDAMSLEYYATVGAVLAATTLDLDLGVATLDAAGRGTSLALGTPLSLDIGAAPLAAEGRGISLALGSPLALDLGVGLLSAQGVGLDLALADPLALSLGQAPAALDGRGLDLALGSPLALGLGAAPLALDGAGLSLVFGTPLELALGRASALLEGRGIDVGSLALALSLGRAPLALDARGLDLALGTAQALDLGRAPLGLDGRGLDLVLAEVTSITSLRTGRARTGALTSGRGSATALTSGRSRTGSLTTGRTK